MKKALCIFDFDGTLVDSMEHFADIAGQVIEENYGTPFGKARSSYLETSGLPFHQQLEILFPNDSRNAASADRFETEKLIDYYERPLFTGAETMLATLRRRGIKVAISSNNFQHLVSAYVSRHKLVLDYALGFREGFAKGRDHFNYLRQRLQLESREMLFVGDSLKDAEKAREARIDFVGKLGTFSKDEFVQHHPEAVTIQELHELIDVVSESQAA